MSTWLNRGACGGLAGARKQKRKPSRPDQPTASNAKIQTVPTISKPDRRMPTYRVTEGNEPAKLGSRTQQKKPQ